MPAEMYKTYEIRSPIETHYRTAKCREVECNFYLRGWVTTVDTSTELGAKQANYIRLHSGRAYEIEATYDSPIVKFYFKPGQTCFTVHKVTLERPEFYVVREGDWRGNPRRIDPYRHSSPADWVDDFANHQDRINDRIQQG